MMKHEKIRNFQREILAWFSKNKRDLPWRRTTDPWHVLVSEVMLQQTQVGRVIPKFLAFTAAWPTPADLARAPLGGVLRAWSGLGYNRRASGLWKASRAMVEDHGGKVPGTVEGLEALPGIGRYTARAVASFAWNADVALWDTNVRRVFLRVFHGGEFAPSLPGPAGLEALLEASLPAGRSRDWHGALMDFGSMVCTSKAPACGGCPLSASCKAAAGFRAGAAAKAPLGRKQTAFDGSPRQVRGEVLRELTAAGGAPRSFDGLARAVIRRIGGGEASVRRAVEGLAEEGLVERRGRRVSLPR